MKDDTEDLRRAMIELASPTMIWHAPTNAGTPTNCASSSRCMVSSRPSSWSPARATA